MGEALAYTGAFAVMFAASYVVNTYVWRDETAPGGSPSMLDFIRGIAERIAQEPVLLRSVAGGVIAAAAIFGVTINDASLDPIIDVLGLLAGIFLSISARAKVTPV